MPTTRDLQPLLESRAAQLPVVTLTGPRHSGKTTLVRAAFPHKAYVSLEEPDQRRFAHDDPRAFLASYPDGAIFDEFQRAPELPSYLQGLVDADPRPGRFILTGSRQFELMRDVSQSLAGRTAVLRLLPFTFGEAARTRGTRVAQSAAQWVVQGFYPRIHAADLDPSQALSDYFATYVERDLRALTAVHDLRRFERFVRLCAGRVGQLVNLTSLSNDAGIAQSTAHAWLDLLQTSCICHLLPPWFVNSSKRLVKTPKLYFYDVGLAAWLLGIRTAEQAVRDPLWGSLFENMIVMEALKQQYNGGDYRGAHFYRDATGHEIDLLLPADGRRWRAVEVKAGATVHEDMFRGLAQFAKAHGDHLEAGVVVYGGDQMQQRSDWWVWPWRMLLTARPDR